MGMGSFLASTRQRLFLALLLLGGGTYLAHRVQTSGGISVSDIRYKSSDGKQVSALLYVPAGVSRDKPAPGIVATHGYINSRETQGGFAIEFARRGYVVLSPDQAGHGFSESPAFANGFGGKDSLSYLRTLDIVDRDNIGLEGHSMGGWASVFAAETNPDGYKSMVLASSSTGTYGAPNGTATFPRNLAVIFSAYDEFSGLMWDAPIATDIVRSEKLKKVFGTSETVEIGKLYGSIADGNARILYQPSMIHPRVHLSTEAIGYAVAWMQSTLVGGQPLDPSDQIWYWKEIGTLLALIGMILLIFPLGDLLLNTGYLRELRGVPAAPRALIGSRWWLAAFFTVLIPIPIYIGAWLFHGKGIAKASYLWPQQITTTIMIASLGVALISLILYIAWRLSSKRAQNLAAIPASKPLDAQILGKSLLLAAGVVSAAYLVLLLSDRLFHIDYRFWVFAVKPLGTQHIGIFLRYLLPFTAFFLMQGLILHSQMRKDYVPNPARITWREMLTQIALLISGYAILLLLIYGPLFMRGSAGIPGQELAGIVAFQFLPMFAIAALISTFFFRRTGRILVGSFVNALLVTWILVAGQATHFGL